MHFVLIHGFCHGSWCWYKTVDLLERSGHRATAVDLASAGTSTASADSILTLDQYDEPLVELLESLDRTEKVILVGHSAAGCSVTHAVELFPEKIAVAVYISAFMGYEGFQPDQIKQLLRIVGAESDKPPKEFIFSIENARSSLYGLCPSQDIILASMLLRRGPLATVLDAKSGITAAKYKSVPRVFIKLLRDKLLPPLLQDAFINANPPQAVFHIDTDHSPFFSAPEELHQMLLLAAARFTTANS
ncbi:hypothetical protein O6H91_07G016900 [Diphasiastrum complanatum]|nr:hypothetical protein O6H91_07G016900 [Diphasiastrum complanatum]